MSVDLTRHGWTATVTVNAPERLNALNSASLDDLMRAFGEVAGDDGVRAVIFTGAGDRAFIAGADIREMSTKTPDEALVFARLGHALASRIESLPQPVIAAVNGFALGGGCELALACDIRHASDRAVFAQPEVQVGIPPGWGGSQRLARVVSPGMAAELILTGGRIDAEGALRIGLVNAVHGSDALLDAVGDLAERIGRSGPQAVRASKRLMAASRGDRAVAALAEEARAFADAFGTDEQVEGMTAFLEKRTASFAVTDGASNS